MTAAEGAETTRMSDASTVLVVDDDDAVRRMFLAALHHGGYRTLQASNGPDALDLLESNTAELALLDVDMPGMSGIEVADRVRQDPRHQAMGILFVSGDASVSSKVAALGAGANDYLVKPLELQELLARVAAHLRDQSQWQDRLNRQLAVRSQLAHRIMELDPGVPLPVLERELLDILSNEVDLADFGIVDPARGGVDGDNHFSVESTDGNVRVRVPLRFAGSLVGIAEATAAGVAAQQVVSTLSDLAPQLGAVVADAMNRQTSADEMRHWIATMVAEGLQPVYQPIVLLSDSSVVGYEGLTRFADGTRPDIAFARASQAGLAPELETAALASLMSRAHLLMPGAWLSVNVSAATLLAGGVDDLLAATDRPLFLELTENDHVDDYAAVRKQLSRLPDVRLAVDDAGAGYSSLRHIFELRPEIIKLDRGWIAEVDLDPVRQALIQGLMGFAGSFGALIVGEGVEREEEAQTLRSLGVPLAQGYLFGRPSAAG